MFGPSVVLGVRFPVWLVGWFLGFGLCVWLVGFVVVGGWFGTGWYRWLCVFGGWLLWRVEVLCVGLVLLAGVGLCHCYVVGFGGFWGLFPAAFSVYYWCRLL